MADDDAPSGQAGGLRGSRSCEVELEGRPRGASSAASELLDWAWRVRSSVERSMECGRFGGAGSVECESLADEACCEVVMFSELVLFRESDGIVVSG